MSKLVPEQDSLEEVYAGHNPEHGLTEEQTARFKNLLSHFKEFYHHKPQFVARSPGRVNIIGEHVDYSLYNVLPTAVTRDVLIAVRTVDSSSSGAFIKVANVNPKYKSSEISIPKTGDVVIDKNEHGWANYFKAGLKGAIQFLRNEYGETTSPKSMEIMVDGNVPAGGGLSSSAAFVCASALAVMKANDHNVSKQDLLDLAIVSEREVGVFSGGMDQAASVFSERGFLLYCRFFPRFSAEHVPVPPSNPEITFLVAQSFVTSDKAVTAPKHYNLRVVEVTLATAVLAKLHDLVLNPDESPLGFSLRNFQQEYMKKKGSLAETVEDQVDAMIAVAKEKLSKESYTREDISKLLGISVQALEKEYMSKFPIQADAFMLRQRALHVFEEARRVLYFKDELSDIKALDDKELKYLGGLMNQTQDSCRDLYDCSCPEIDEMCTIARNAGAYGSRLTGAGWGGCTVHLIPEEKVDAVTKALKKEYYDKKFPNMTEEGLKEAMVISQPSQGSSVIFGAALDL